MRIIDVKTWVVGNQYFIFVKLTTDNQIIGYGEVYASTFSSHVITQMIKDVAERFFIDQSPFQIEKLWRQVYDSGYNLRPDVSLVGVLSGLEMTCWDIIGKSLNKPVYQLLGGKVHDRPLSYTYIYTRPGDKT